MKKLFNKELLAGSFFIIGILAVIFTIIILGGKAGLGETKYFLAVVFSDVGGLRIGAPVRVAGVDVGNVSDIEFISNRQHPDKRVKVTLTILSRYKKEVDKCSLFSIKTEGLLGDKLIDIQLPPKNEIYDLPKMGELIIGQDPLDIKNLADDFSETTKYFIYLSKKMSEMIEELNKIALSSKRILGRLEERIIESSGLLDLFIGGKKRK